MPARVYAFPPEARLRTPADFAGLRRCRKPLRGQFFVVRHVAADSDLARLGLAVSRKTSKRAVVRNRIKRVTRESFRYHRRGLPAVDVLVIARSPAADADKASLRAELARHWQQLRRLYARPQTDSSPRPRSR